MTRAYNRPPLQRIFGATPKTTGRQDRREEQRQYRRIDRQLGSRQLDCDLEVWDQDARGALRLREEIRSIPTPSGVDLGSADFTAMEMRIAASFGAGSAALQRFSEDLRQLLPPYPMVTLDSLSAITGGAEVLRDPQPNGPRTATQVDTGRARNPVNVPDEMADALLYALSPEVQRSIRMRILKPRPEPVPAPPHPDAGKVINRPKRSVSGVMVEDVRNADGSVSRRPRKD